MRILLLILLIPLFGSCQTEKQISKYPARVGDILFDEKLDAADFKRCSDEKIAFQYYNDSKGFQYEGEKIKIEGDLKSLRLKSSKKENGYITIRFLVNCEGETGLFRIQQMNEDYKKAVFDKKLTEQLLTFTKKLNGWIPKQINGKKADYYQYLTYKIENGTVSEILP